MIDSTWPGWSASGTAMDRSRYDNQSKQWRKRQGAQRRRARLLAGAPKRLVLWTVAAVAALTAQFVMQRGGDMPDVNLSNLIGLKPDRWGRVRHRWRHSHHLRRPAGFRPR